MNYVDQSQYKSPSGYACQINKESTQYTTGIVMKGKRYRMHVISKRKTSLMTEQLLGI